MTRARPIPLILAILLHGIASVYWFDLGIKTLWAIHMPWGDWYGVSVVLVLITLPMGVATSSAILGIGLWQQWRWAYWLDLILLIAAIALIARTNSETPVMQLLGLANGTVICLLFFPSVNRHFRRRHPHQQAGGTLPTSSSAH